VGVVDEQLDVVLFADVGGFVAPADRELVGADLALFVGDCGGRGE
jgi:hypothetical protein